MCNYSDTFRGCSVWWTVAYLCMMWLNVATYHSKRFHKLCVHGYRSVYVTCAGRCIVSPKFMKSKWTFNTHDLKIIGAYWLKRQVVLFCSLLKTHYNSIEIISRCRHELNRWGTPGANTSCCRYMHLVPLRALHNTRRTSPIPRTNKSLVSPLTSFID